MSKPITNALRALGHAALAPLEALLASKGSPRASLPPCFIIGAPRSGTSLVYEAMITRFRWAYIGNAAHRFYRTPLAATWLTRGALAHWQGQFSSDMGHIDGWAAPNEGGWVWRRWLADGDWHDGSALSPAQISGARGLVSGLERIVRAPFLNKNVMHANRLLAMNRLWDDARFIVVRRDVAENARSIIRAERGHKGPPPDAQFWWSVRPSLTPEWTGRSTVARAVAQVIGVERDIARDAAVIGPRRFHTIDYAAFCADPEAEMLALSAFLAETGGAPDGRFDLPARFALSPAAPLDDADEAEIAATLRELGAA